MPIQAEMSNSLHSAYHLDTALNIWTRIGFKSISYSDGDATEMRLLDIVTKSRDLSVLSEELKRACTDWPSLYHLSSARANVLRPFESFLKNKEVLEIGAGCGAITRCLGEWGAEVTALEGSHRRACIARSRTRDLQNVTVVADNFSDFQSASKFDVITLIGVLEYANLFVKGPHADHTMLSRARDLLKDDGVLIIAIENQLGLKYFAGFPEDHKGIVGYGIENRYRAQEVQTYGRVALQGLLNNCRFDSQKFYAAFPDYKLPSVIISEEGFEEDGFDCASLVSGTGRQDAQMPATLAFEPERTWPLLCRNQLAMDFANSFIVVAGCLPNRSTDIDAGGYAWHFNGNRHSYFTKNTVFTKSKDGTKEVRRSRLLSETGLLSINDQLSNEIIEREPYFEGSLLHNDFVHLLSNDGWDDEALHQIGLKYIEALGATIGTSLDQREINETKISGSFLDAIPQNIVRMPDGTWRLLDQEWRWNESINLSYLIFRAFLSILGSISSIGKHKNVIFNNRLELLTHCLEVIGASKHADAINDHFLMEAKVQELSGGFTSKDIDLRHQFSIWPCARHNIWEKANELQNQVQIADRYLHVAEKTVQEHGEHTQTALAKAEELRLLNEHIKHELQQTTKHCESLSAQLDHGHQHISNLEKVSEGLRLEVIQQQQHALNLEKVIDDRERFIHTIINSRSWRLTKPVRLFSRMLSFRRTKASAAIEKKNQISLQLTHWLNKPTSICLCIHAFYPELLAEMSPRLQDIPLKKRALVTTTPENFSAVSAIVKNWPFPTKVISVENRGRDILPFLTILNQVRPNELILKIHTKKSTHRRDGHVWRNDLLSKLLEPKAVRDIFSIFRSDHKLGMVVPEGHVLSVDEFMGQNRERYDAVCKSLMPMAANVPSPLFAGGAMFFARHQALMALAHLGQSPERFDPEQGQLDATMAHAIERILGVAVQTQGYRISSTADLKNPATSKASRLHTDPLI